MTGKQVKRLRDRMGLSRAEFGKRLGVNESTVWRWEHDKSPVLELTALALKHLASQLEAAE